MDIEKDIIRIAGKKQAAEHIVRRYGDFGWELIESKDDKRYGDTGHMTFTRPHFIENKDELQLLQVRLEIAYNNTGRLAAKSSRRAAFVASLAMLFVAAFLVGGVFLLLNGGILPLIFGVIACAFGAAIATAGGIYAGNVYKKDVVKYTRLIEKEIDKIEELCAKARELRGGNE